MHPNELRVAGDQPIAATETLLVRLQQRPGPFGLLLPTHVSSTQFGGLSLLIQFLITWAKKGSDQDLILHMQKKNDATEYLNRLLSTDHGLAALLLAPSVRGIDGAPLPSTVAVALIYLQTIWEDLTSRCQSLDQHPRGFRKPFLFLLAADHSATACPQLYHQSRPPQLKDTTDFSTQIDQCFRLLSDQSIPHNADLPFGLILYELFRNTDDWARKNWDGSGIARSIRGIRFELHSNMADLAGYVRGTPQIHSFLVAHPHLERARNKRVLEISVFDSGSGLAQHWLKRPILDDERINPEYEAVVDCLRPHKSSSSEAHRGIGLHDVMLALTKAKGFLWLRSGRLSVYRDFLQRPYGDGQQPFLLDWQTGKDDALSIAPRVEGTCFTILVPLPASP